MYHIYTCLDTLHIIYVNTIRYSASLCRLKMYIAPFFIKAIDYPHHPSTIHPPQLFIVKSGIDVKRLVTLSVFGFIYHGPSGHYFYNWLDSKISGTDGVSVASKVAIDQIFWCPIFMCVFFTYLGLVSGDSFGTIGNKIKTDLLTAVQGSWKIWPVVHAINFKFISTKHRLVFINGVQIVFNMFLSLLGSK